MKKLPGLKAFIVAIALAISAPSYSQYSLINSITVNESNAFALLGKDRKTFGFGVIDSKGTLIWNIDIL